MTTREEVPRQSQDDGDEQEGGQQEPEHGSLVADQGTSTQPLTATVNKPFACPECAKRFPRRDTVRRHIKDIHSDKDVSQLLAQHEVVNKGVHRSYTCEVCEEAFKSPSGISQHRKSKHGLQRKASAGDRFLFAVMDRVACDCALLRSEGYSLLHSHVFTPVGRGNLDREQATFPCSSCNASFITAKRLMDHLVQVHNNQTCKSEARFLLWLQPLSLSLKHVYATTLCVCTVSTFRYHCYPGTCFVLPCRFRTRSCTALSAPSVPTCSTSAYG